MKRLFWSVVAALVLVIPSVASAADGYVTGNVSLRAGPDTDYPRITMIQSGSRISIQGCTDGWEWCDVVSGGDRGWIDGNFIQYDYQNQRVYLPAYGQRIGIPIVSFVIGTYWNNYYRNRPFYRDRTRWYNRPMPHRPPPRPNGHRPQRPGHGHVVPLPKPIPGRPVHPARPGHRPSVRPPGNHRPDSQRPTPRPKPQPTGSRPSKPGGNQGTRPSIGKPVRPAPQSKKPNASSSTQ